MPLRRHCTILVAPNLQLVAPNLQTDRGTAGTPSGIRTRDLHLERVMSWATRRWGRVAHLIIPGNIENAKLLSRTSAERDLLVTIFYPASSALGALTRLLNPL